MTSVRSGRWGVPKGIVDPGETPRQTAVKEADEEAGVTGRLLRGSVGSYEYQKWGIVLRVVVYLLEVDTVARTWDEASFRRRFWVTPERALQLVARHPPREILESAIQRLSRVR